MTKTLVIGHVGNVKFTKQDAVGEKPGFTVLAFSVASNETTRGGKEVTNWHACRLWGPRAEALKDHLVKGQAVVVEGRAEARAYLTKEGKAEGELVVHVATFEFIGAKPENAPDSVAGDPPVEGADAE